MDNNINQSQPIQLEIKLDVLEGKYLRQLQRLIDILNISLVGLERVDEPSYSDYSFFFRVIPAQNFRLTKDLAETEAKKWYLCSVFRDAIEITNSFVEECWLVCSFFSACSKGPMLGEEYNKLMTEGKRKVHSLGLPIKLKKIRNEFGVYSELEPHVLSINTARACLVHRFGIVTSLDTDNNKELIIKWRSINLIARSPDEKKEIQLVRPGVMIEAGWKVMGIVADQQKTFQEGEQIELSFIEIGKTILTLMNFAGQTVNSIKEYSKRIGIKTS